MIVPCRSNDRRSSVVVREGERRRDYEAGRLESLRSSRYPDRFRADLAFSRVTEEDADYRRDIQHSHWQSIIGPFSAWKPPD